MSEFNPNDPIAFAKWYDELIFDSDLASSGLVKGTIFLHPKACYIWERIQWFINKEFKKHGIKNVMFPALIPLKEIDKEKQALTGFVPELFFVKSSNEKDKQESTFLRPTSEILFSHYFKKKLESYDQLPFLINQWSSVYRSEKNTKAFLRTSEFYWQEAHTIHENFECAMNYLKIFHSIYEKLINDFLKIEVLIGEKTINECFVGAEKTLTIEGIMPDGQVLQMATSHYLAKNFTKTFEIKYTNKTNEKDYPHQLSAGCSTRLIGAIIMSHSNKSGLNLPIELIETKYKVLVLHDSVVKNDLIYKKINEIIGFENIEWDFSNKSFGQKINKSEKEGIPFVLIIGKQEIEDKSLLFKSKLSNEKIKLKIDDLSIELNNQKEIYSRELREKTKKNLISKVVEAKTLEDALKEIKNKKVVLVPWFNDENNEVEFKSKGFAFGPRCIKEKLKETDLKCFYSNKTANCLAYFGRSY